MRGAPLPLLIPGNMCDARLWDGGDRAIRKTLASATGRPAWDVDTTRDDSIAAMATRALAMATGPLIPIGFSMGRSLRSKWPCKRLNASRGSA